VLGTGACHPLARYAAEDATHAWGACGFAAGALAHLGSDTAACAPTADDREAFAGLLAVADTLASMP
jgi:hypothetical protein